MIADPEVLRGLLERVKVAEGPDRVLDTHLHWLLNFGVRPDASMRPSPDVDAYTRSIDAALSLVRSVLPNWWVQLRTGSDFQPEAWCERSGRISDIQHGQNEALAILAALLTALAKPDRLPETATGGETV